MNKKMTFEKQIKVRALLKEDVYYSLKNKPRGFNKRVNDLVELMENLTDGVIEWSEIKHLDSLEELVIYFNKRGLLDVSALQQPTLNSFHLNSETHYATNNTVQQSVVPTLNKPNNEIPLKQHPQSISEQENRDSNIPITSQSIEEHEENSEEQIKADNQQHNEFVKDDQISDRNESEMASSEKSESKADIRTEETKTSDKEGKSDGKELDEKTRQRLKKLKKRFG
ncbi:hypothetical protein P8818_14490 [Bacillus velezensis]|uniref:hypothetical protein n=1 Tax=Bacillus amyloliquefaciens group TaxID=1938374 RepID=UPI002DBF128D|nr:hypothetical protein [Bacillus velezensis]MEC0385627.1 hypothetical protein [Bacillus velezensis]MEC0388769.1 hypothetical protein [Bacillus velezensis]